MKIKLAVSLLILSVFACTDEKMENDLEKKIPVILQQVSSKEILQPIRTSGKISSQQEIRLSFKTGGIIETITVSEGEQVHKGDVLASLNLDEIRSQVSKAKLGFTKSKRDFVRIEKLFKDSVVTLEQYENTKTAMEVAKENYEIAMFNLEYSVIKAPSDGKLYKKLAETNEIVGPGTPVFIFGSQTNRWKLKTGLTYLDITKISLGDSAKIYLDLLEGEFLKGKVSEIAGAIDPMNSTFEVEIQISETDSKLISGLIGIVEIFPKSEGSAKVVPINSLVNADDKTAELFVLKNDSTVSSVKVELGDIINEEVIILDGLENDTKIIVDGVEYLYEGAKVEVINVKGEQK